MSRPTRGVPRLIWQTGRDMQAIAVLIAVGCLLALVVILLLEVPAVALIAGALSLLFFVDFVMTRRAARRQRR